MVFKKGYSLLIIGDGFERKNLESLVRERGVEDQVHFQGMIPFGELPAWTRKGHIGIHLVRAQSLNIDRTWPNKIFDYVHAGLPILMGRTTAMETFLEIHKVGVIVNPDDPNDIKRGIQEILENYSEFYDNCKKAVLEWNWDNSEKHLVKFLN